jgi:hypothetical protein
MDDIALNPDFYDLFREPVLAGAAFGWLFLLLALRAFSQRASDVFFYIGAFILGATAADPVLAYVKAEVPLLIEQSKLEWQAKSADPLRERDPFFALLQVYLKANPSHPLTVVSSEDGDTIRWARYYLSPRPVVLATEEQLANFLPSPDEPARWILTNKTPRVPADADLAVEGRVDDWLLFRLQHRGTP